MFTLYRIGFCTVSKVVKIRYVHRCDAKINVSKIFTLRRFGPDYIISQSPFQIPVVHSCLDNSPFTSKRFRCNSCLTKLLRLGPDRFKNPSVTEGSIFNSEAEQSCSRAKLFQNWRFHCEQKPYPIYIFHLSVSLCGIV